MIRLLFRLVVPAEEPPAEGTPEAITMLDDEAITFLDDEAIEALVF